LESQLEICEIKKFYGQETILYDISLTIRKKEMISIVGESGTGKTTLLSIIGLLQNPTSGKVIIKNQLATDLTSSQRAALRSAYIGFVFQRARLVGSLTALENVLVPVWLFARENQATATVYARELLCELGLQHRLDYLPEQLSIGQIRRVAFARALVLNPDIILADEPTNDLDGDSAAVVMRYLHQAQHNGAAVILVTHDEQQAAQADRMLRLKQGRLLNA